ncbi:MAG: VOC family protein [Chthoniobacteraceae bacterium]
MLKVIEFAFTAYSVTDTARAREFYEKALNLTPASTFEHEGKSWIEYEVGPHVLAITNMQPDWKPSPNGGGVALEVEDFDAAIAWLREKGVKFYAEPFPSPVCRMALIADPDGNSIAIHKRNAG